MSRLPLKSQLRRRSLVVLPVAAAACLSTPTWAKPQFPTKAVQIICAFPPGNASDIVARIIAERLSQRWGQTVYVENRPGASGIIAAQAVQQAKPDGYTLLMTSTSFVINNSVLKNVPYTVDKDFTAISMVNSVPVVLLVGNNFPATSMSEWIAAVKAKPGKFTYGHPGVGTIHNLSSKLLLQQTGTNVLDVPYKGSVNALNDIMAGNVDMMFEAANSAFTYVQTGKMRALATSGPTRYYALPNVPTMQEAGVNINTVGFTGILAPANTPADVRDFLNAEVQAVLKQPDVQTALRNTAMELLPPMSATEAQNWLKNESQRWAQVASAAKIAKE